MKQPLLERGGVSTKRELSRTLSGYDEQIQAYYEKILMRWPKATLTKHNIILYERKGSTFRLNFHLSDAELVEAAKDLCEQLMMNATYRLSATAVIAPSAIKTLPTSVNPVVKLFVISRLGTIYPMFQCKN
ncbi:hypothetical protein [Candidatus Viridilinea mediisalina]|uniref:Uncharacterized protein n=1 Tax=Candidatus Viridilinea mediisalina TaxID=2024553 RepID=A0A2A6RI02_9CHLR|nr:hypothetical protein [Candidatus Viridilinea mediisalina]PDW02509.1 hypothetical protein CJ255_13585 [Candidatus Viridilinea mediisalina]